MTLRKHLSLITLSLITYHLSLIGELELSKMPDRTFRPADSSYQQPKDRFTAAARPDFRKLRNSLVMELACHL